MDSVCTSSKVNINTCVIENRIKDESLGNDLLEISRNPNNLSL